MTRKQKLETLRDRVKSGEADGNDFNDALRFLSMNVDCVHFGKMAHRGSMDAALTLFAAVLLGWNWLARNCCESDRVGHDIDGFANVWGEKYPIDDGERFIAWSTTPARALLIAIISALIVIEGY